MFEGISVKIVERDGKEKNSVETPEPFFVEFSEKYLNKFIRIFFFWRNLFRDI